MRCRSEAQTQYLEGQQPPQAILDLIIRRLPVASLRTVSLASYCFLDAVLSLPRPTLLDPGHADEPWWLHFPSRLAPRGDILIESQLSGDRKLTHRCLRIPQGLGLPNGDAPRLIGGHPSHPIFIQGQYCITCSVITHRVHVHALLIPGIPEEDVFVLRGAISTSFLSPEADSATPMLLLATKSHLLGRPLLDYTASWAIRSLRGTVLGTVTDIVFAHQIWYMMDDRRRLYRVSFSELTLDIQEMVVDLVPAQTWRNVMRHWLLSWPSGSILCLCFLASTRHDSYGNIIEEGTYQAYLLQFCQGDRPYFWQELHHLHSCSVFVNWAQGGLAFAYEYPDRWGLQRDLVYDTDLEVVDLVRVNYIDGLPSQHQNWPSRMWLLLFSRFYLQQPSLHVLRARERQRMTNIEIEQQCGSFGLCKTYSWIPYQ